MFLKQRLSQTYSETNKLIYNSNMYDGAIEATIPLNFKYKKTHFIKNLTFFIVNIFKNFNRLKIANYNLLKNQNIFSKIKDGTIDPFKKIQCMNCFVALSAKHPND